MLKLIKFFVIIFIFFYAIAFVSYVMTGLIYYKSRGEFIFNIDHFYDIFPNVVVLTVLYMLLTKLCAFLGLTNDSDIKGKNDK